MFRMNELLGELEKLMECQVCRKIIEPPLNECQNIHLLCPDCRENLPVCPSCDAQLEDVADHYCENADLGCEKRSLLVDLEDHADTCEYRRYFCRCVIELTLPTERYCVWGGSKDGLVKHVHDEHSSFFEAKLNSDGSATFSEIFHVEGDRVLVSALNELFWFVAKARGSVQMLCFNSRSVAPMFKYDTEIWFNDNITIKWNNAPMAYFRQSDYKESVLESFPIPFHSFPAAEATDGLISFKVTIFKVEPEPACDATKAQGSSKSENE